MKTQYKYEFYLGTDISGTDIVTDEMFDTFLVENVQPYFKGFSVSEITGYWKGLKETTKVLIIIDSLIEMSIVNRIGNAYKNTFKQESVLVTKQHLEFIEFI